MSRYFTNLLSKLGSLPEDFFTDLADGCTPISGTDLLAIIRATIGGIEIPVGIYLVDVNYQCPALKDIKRMLTLDGTDKIKYQAEATDCDDFAWILSGRVRELAMRSDLRKGGIAFGMVFGYFMKDGVLSESHAMNFFVDSNKKFHLVEPQTDKLYDPHPNNKYIAFIV